MADEGVSSGEVYRRLADHERRTDTIHAALDSRITDVARDMVPLTLYNQAERDRDREIQRLETEHDQDLLNLRDNLIKPLADRVRALEDRPAMTLGRWLGVVTVAIALVGLLVQAYGTLKGAK
ncbi:hypothetical protein [Streptomyces sp. NPDC006739]|uniref:hypothetical protein n=1 Tax=Streptomyces sp. NPDC006739 TaxID=3364763 RepID=UPI00368C7AF5